MRDGAVSSHPGPFLPGRAHRSDSWLLPRDLGPLLVVHPRLGSPQLSSAPLDRQPSLESSVCGGDPSPQGRPSCYTRSMGACGVFLPLTKAPPLPRSQPPLAPAPLPAQPPAPRSLLGPLPPGHPSLGTSPLPRAGGTGLSGAQCVWGEGGFWAEAGAAQRRGLPRGPSKEGSWRDVSPTGSTGKSQPIPVSTALPEPVPPRTLRSRRRGPAHGRRD